MNIAIIGANRGIGLALTKKYQAQGHKVYAFCRKTSEDLNQLSPEKIVENFDVKNTKAMKQCVEDIQAIKFDEVIHVSGILKSDRLDSVNEDDLLEQFRVNSIGPIFSYKAFSEHMDKGTKFCVLTSRMGSIADNSSGGNFGYRMSKSAVNMAAKNLSIEAKEQGITVLILHPGYVKTDMTGNNGNISPKDSAEQLMEVIKEKDFSDTGTFWHANGEPLPW